MNIRINDAVLRLSIILALPLLSGLPAAAVSVTIGTNSYDVTVFTGSYASNTLLFQALPPGKMPWFADSTGDTASEFATQAFNLLGIGPTSGYGPVFAYEVGASGVIGLSQSLSDPSSQNLDSIALDTPVAYAIATPLGSPLSPVPSPLPVFGAMAAYGWSGKMRKQHRDRQPLR